MERKSKVVPRTARQQTIVVCSPDRTIYTFDNPSEFTDLRAQIRYYQEEGWKILCSSNNPELNGTMISKDGELPINDRDIYTYPLGDNVVMSMMFLRLRAGSLSIDEYLKKTEYIFEKE